MASVGALYIIVWSQLLSNTITQRIAVRLRLCLCGVVCGCGVDAAWCECGVVCGCVCVCDTLQWMDGRCAHVKLWPDVLHGRAELPHKLPPEYQRRPGIISYHIISDHRTETHLASSFPFLSFSFSFKVCSSRACLGKSSLVHVKTLKKSAVFCVIFIRIAIARSRAACTILTTHSSTLAQALPLRSVRKKERNGGGGFVRPLLV